MGESIHKKVFLIILLHNQGFCCILLFSIASNSESESCSIYAAPFVFFSHLWSLIFELFALDLSKIFYILFRVALGRRFLFVYQLFHKRFLKCERALSFQQKKRGEKAWSLTITYNIETPKVQSSSDALCALCICNIYGVCVFDKNPELFSLFWFFRCRSSTMRKSKVENRIKQQNKKHLVFCFAHSFERVCVHEVCQKRKSNTISIF